MKRVGFIIKNTKNVNGKEYEYFYLRRIERIKGIVIDGKYPKKQENIFSFGNKKKALMKLNDWENNFALLPNNLKAMGYTLEDIKKWKLEIENK